MRSAAALPKRVLPPLFNRYAGAHNHYGNHVDQAIRHLPGTQQRVRTDLSATLFLAEPQTYAFDVVIYGASPAAVSAACQAKKMGKSVGVFVFGPSK